MNQKGLFVFVEGNDDERFFNELLIKKLNEKYDYVKIIKYAQEKKSYVKNFIKSIRSMRADYIYVTDINGSICVTAKKRKVKKAISNIDISKILVVVKEIESWYIAGVNKDSAKKLRINNIPSNTNKITKEVFNKLMPTNFSSRIDFMREILKNFSLDIATQKNKSFKYFLEKFN